MTGPVETSLNLSSGYALDVKGERYTYLLGEIKAGRIPDEMDYRHFGREVAQLCAVCRYSATAKDWLNAMIEIMGCFDVMVSDGLKEMEWVGDE